VNSETGEQQRTRILTGSPETSPDQYDAAVALGYEPESWDGMWKLPTGHPIIWLTKRWALVREIVYHPGTHRAVYTRTHRSKTRWRLRRTTS
jgi:hypothetical protein